MKNVSVWETALTSKAATSAVGCRAAGQRGSSEQAGGGTGEPSSHWEWWWHSGCWASALGSASYSRELQIPDTSDSWDRITACCSVFSVQINVLCILNGNLNQIGTWHENYHFGTVIQKEILFQEIWAFCLKQVNYNSDWVSSVKIKVFLMVNAFKLWDFWTLFSLIFGV